MPVDSFAYLPRSFRAEYETVTDPPAAPEWARLARPVEESTVALLTSAGLYLRDGQEPFDLDRERAEPFWGDPTYRLIPSDARPEEVAASHLHLNTRDLEEDYNVALPIRAFAQLAAAGRIGGLADEHYSFMGYQARGLREWRERYGPEVVQHLRENGVDAVVLAPA